MAKNKLERLTEKFETGNYELDALQDVEFTVSKNAKSIRMVPVERSIFNELEKFAKEKKTTAEKLMELWILPPPVKN